MWHHLPETDELFSCLATHTSRDADAEIVFLGDDTPSASQCAMFAEALNVHEQTGLTPAQLQARVAELEGATEAARYLLRKYSHDLDMVRGESKSLAARDAENDWEHELLELERLVGANRA